MTNVLTQIFDYKRAYVASREIEVPIAALEAQAKKMADPTPFAAALRACEVSGGFALIAELKKASPSKGLIRPNFDPETLAEAYLKGGATCLSVLTDGPSFQGNDDFLGTAKLASDLPVLRKDFMLDPYQIVESRALGADCILVIMAGVSDVTAAELVTTAQEWNMDTLVEVHNMPELERALRLQGSMIGINNRNLKTLEVDLATAETLAPEVPASWHIVGESGLRKPEDLRRLSAVGVNSFLVGESLMREDDVTAATQRFLARD